MSNYYLGIALLIAILFARFAVARWRRVRFERRWMRAQEAIRDGNWVAAEAALRDCVRMVPIAGPVHRMMGVVLARRGKLKEAEERLRFGAELEPRNPAGFMELGFFLTARFPEREDDAVNAFAKAVEHAPDLREALSNEPRLEHLRRNERFRKLLEARRDR